MMASPVMLFVLLVYLGATQKVFGMPENVVGDSKSLSISEKLEENSFTSLGYELIETADIFLRGLTDKYSDMNDQMEKSIKEYDGSSIDNSIDCTSTEAVEMMSLKKTFDYCNNMTLELTELKKTAAELIKAFQDIGMSSSVVVSEFYECTLKPNPFIQASCVMQVFLNLQTSYIAQKPRFKKLYAKLSKSYRLIYIDMWQCFYADSSFSKSIPKMAQYSVMCN
ncbi:uncharacterized protein LOC111054632 [Nilaparvata lugens]|uniref:uncharacterized protein LOC111054632 n=1 Tax=Nilaparvata lugens TaxID=108931 RepID=UPI00193CBB12|nr:uncharacterized protein LOC111054632 [Nilaparvata lugens]